MTLLAELVGGPLDGLTRPVQGIRLLYPDRPTRRYYDQDAEAVLFHFPIGEYRLQRADNGRLIYVHATHPS